MTIQDIDERVQRLSDRIGLACALQIEQTDNSLDPAFVSKTNGHITLFVNVNKLETINIPIDDVLLHELYHVRQLTARYPIVVSAQPDRRMAAINNSVMDCCVTADMCETGYTDAAYTIFLSRVDALECRLPDVVSEDGMQYRAAQLIAESSIWFREHRRRLQMILKERYGSIYHTANMMSSSYLEMIEMEDRRNATASFLGVFLRQAGYRVVEMDEYMIAERE